MSDRGECTHGEQLQDVPAVPVIVKHHIDRDCHKTALQRADGLKIETAFHHPQSRGLPTPRASARSTSHCWTALEASNKVAR
jgi:hypothetical protein